MVWKHNWKLKSTKNNQTVNKSTEKLLNWTNQFKPSRIQISKSKIQMSMKTFTSSNFNNYLNWNLWSIQFSVIMTPKASLLKSKARNKRKWKLSKKKLTKKRKKYKIRWPLDSRKWCNWKWNKRRSDCRIKKLSKNTKPKSQSSKRILRRAKMKASNKVNKFRNSMRITINRNNRLVLSTTKLVNRSLLLIKMPQK